MSANQKKEETLEELFKKYVERHQKEINDNFAKKMKEQLDSIQKAIDDLKKTLKEKWWKTSVNWLPPSYKGVEILYPSDWNSVVSDLYFLYYYYSTMSNAVNQILNLVQNIQPPQNAYVYQVELTTALEKLSTIVGSPKAVTIINPQTSSYVTYVYGANGIPVPIFPNKKITLQITDWQNVEVSAENDTTIFIVSEEWYYNIFILYIIKMIHLVL